MPSCYGVWGVPKYILFIQHIILYLREFHIFCMFIGIPNDRFLWCVGVGVGMWVYTIHTAYYTVFKGVSYLLYVH